MSKKLLIVGAHSADFVWRASGTIAVTTASGGSAHVVALSYGERGESGELWKEPGQTEAKVKRIRAEQAERAASAIGARFTCLDLGDYPLRVDDNALERLIRILRDDAPNAILTHTAIDPFNPDHPVAYEVVQQARLLTSGAGVESAFERITPPALYLFEPHQPELCGFQPNVFVDISEVFDQKMEAMNALGAQSYLIGYYTELADRRGNHARRISGDQNVRKAEALQRVLPAVVKHL